ncbi:MAG: T9SS type A sorting domain-containing protein [Bacteroidota bacterium]|nr:T9SS type A sorting domain-containing protein [Bacteroidota bacterium]MDP3144792.1 T9SS type A sorting domain-containing protein [Bacteroidota bacterium]
MIRYNKIFFLVCLLPLLCKGQTYFNNYYKTGYNNTFSTHVFNNVVDSSFTVFNYATDSVTGYQGLYSTNISKTGTLNFKKVLTYPNYDYYSYLNGLKQFIPATNCSYIGASVTYTSSLTTILLTKINKVTLDTIKTSFYYDGVYGYYMNNLIKFNDNKYYLIGNKSHTSGQWPCVFQLDSNLNIISTFTISNSINLTTTNVVLNPISKKLVFGGTVLYSSTQQNVGFIESDTLGTVSTSTVIAFSGVQGMAQLKYSLFDNCYVFNGGIKTSQYGPNNMYKLNITKLSSSLNVLWSKKYASAAISNNFNGMIINLDGSVVSCGRYSDSTALPLVNYDNKGVILKTKPNGDSLWMRQYNNYITGSSPVSYNETFFGVEKTLDGGYILCGNVMNQPQAKAWLVKTDSLGCISIGCGNIITSMDEKVREGNITLFPNPANDVLNINSELQFSNAEVINSLGQLVLSKEMILKDQKAIINIKDLPNGVYLLYLKNNNSKTVSKRFVVSR